MMLTFVSPATPERYREMTRRLQLNDGFPLDAGEYTIEFTRTPRVTAKWRFDEFNRRCLKTRKNFEILHLHVERDYIFVHYRHDGLRDDV